MNEALFSLDDRVVAVTGGLGQLGRQFTLALLDRGARVAVLDLDADDVHVRARFGQRSADEALLCLPCDVTDPDALERALEQITGQWTAPHGLINAAALDSPPDAPAAENGPFERYPPASWREVMRVNVDSVFHCCQVIGGRMAREGRGTIVNISSIYGVVSPDQRIYRYRDRDGERFVKPVAYSASKSALISMGRYLATYWAEVGVRVNTLTLGGVFNDQDAQFLEGYCARVPLGRMAREDEYSGAVIFLLSDASSYMTGSNLVIDGGWTAW